MGTWISHLRIAENLLRIIPDLDPIYFTFGSLAPDSGIPNANWSKFDPPKSITHFLPENRSDGESTQDLIFFRKYLQEMNSRSSKSEYSFNLGYFYHLICDHLWWKKIGIASKIIFDKEFREEPEICVWEHLKEDWYDLDQKYLNQNPDSLFLRVLVSSPIPRSSLPFMRQDAFEYQIKHIINFYTNPDKSLNLDRKFLYLNEKTLDKYIYEATSSIIKISKALVSNEIDPTKLSAVELLEPFEKKAYESPIGDN